MTRLTLPDVKPVLTLDGQPAFLLRVGPGRWPVLIARSDFEEVSRRTKHEYWGIQGRNVVLGSPDLLAGRPSVARLLTGSQSDFMIAYRDGNPLNLLQSNLGLRSRASGKVWWLELRSGEVDPVYDTRGFANHVPAVVAARRAIILGDRPMSVPWPKRINPTRRHLPPKPKAKWVAELEAEEQRLRGSQTVASNTS